MTAETTEFLSRERNAIVSAAEAALERSKSPHYEAAGAQTVHERLETLFDHLLQISTRAISDRSSRMPRMWPKSGFKAVTTCPRCRQRSTH